MSKGKVYLFGCSHTAGHELGPKKVDDKKFLKARGWQFASDAQRKLSPSQFEKQIVLPWYKQINNVITPQWSWAGRIADKINKSIIVYAAPGQSLVEQVYHLLQVENKINWDKDLVCFGVPPDGRIMVNRRGRFESIQINNLLPFSDKKSQQQVLDTIPSEESMLLYHYGLISYIKKRWPYVILIETTNPNEIIDSKIVKLNNLFYVEKGLKEFATMFIDKHSDEDIKYPGGHFKEHIHDKYSNYVLEKLTKDENYSKIII